MPFKPLIFIKSLILTAWLFLIFFLASGVSAQYYIYQDSLASGWQDWSWSASNNLQATEQVYQGNYSISFTTTAAWGGLKLHNYSSAVDTTPYSHFTFAAKATQTGQRYQLQLYTAAGSGPTINLDNYGGQPNPNQWRLYQLPLSTLGMSYSQVKGFQLQEINGTSQPALYLDQIGFTGSALPTPTPTLTPTPGATINTSFNVNAGNVINSFSPQMTGLAMVNWMHSWGKPFPNEVPGLKQAYQAAGVKLIRYGGGLWANWIGFSRHNQRTPQTEWISPYNNTSRYYYHYGTNELASLAAFAQNIGAEVIIQVNISDNDPLMWADMVRYSNIENNYHFKYWEISNELDHECTHGSTSRCLTPTEYASRLKTYIDAMKSVDPSIEILGGVPASAHDAYRTNGSSNTISAYMIEAKNAASSQNRKVDSLSYHWYMMCNSGSDWAKALVWQWPGYPESAYNHTFSRYWSQLGPTRIQNEVIGSSGLTQGITELNLDACEYESKLNGNHINALWSADVLGRLAYFGTDYVTWWDGYDVTGYPMIYPNNDLTPTTLYLRPSYYPFFMYANYFGDRLVEVNQPLPDKISLWASTDTKDPGKLKLMLTNLSTNTINATVNLAGFSALTGSVYVLQSNNPTDTGSQSNTAAASTNINGIKLNGMDVYGSAAAISPQNFNLTGSSFTRTLAPFTVTAIILTSASPTTPPALIGDITGDGKVDWRDLLALITDFDRSGQNLPADLNGNGKIDIFDFNLVLKNYGKTN